MRRIENYILYTNPHALPYVLTEAEIRDVNKLVNDKYGRWDWNFGESPVYNFNKAEKFECGIVHVLMNVKEGIITDIHIFGDFFSNEDINSLTSSLIGVLHRKDDIQNVLCKIDVTKYLPNVMTVWATRVPGLTCLPLWRALPVQSRGQEIYPQARLTWTISAPGPSAPDAGAPSRAHRFRSRWRLS